jgi:hypothetical protein
MPDEYMHGNQWLGGFQTNPNSGPAADWHWVTGETWDYTNWYAPKEPNDFLGIPENYLNFGYYLPVWNDCPDTCESYGSHVTGFFIEWNNDPLAPVPEPASVVLLGTGLLALYRRRRQRDPAE